MKETQHVPVLLEKVLEILHLTPGMTVVDATLGGGGYTIALLERVLPGGKVVALDWDASAVKRFRELAAKSSILKRAIDEGRLLLFHRRYSELQAVLLESGIGAVDAVVADLGLSSDQLSDSERGLSFLSDGPLDMRLNTNEKVTAEDIVNQWSEEKLRELLQTYGDETEAGRIARAIVKARSVQPLTRTIALAAVVSQAVSPWRRRARIHPATKTFQALRMAVNSELAELERFLPQAVAALAPKGKLVMVTFHSGEDTIVKRFIEEESRGCTCGLVPCLCKRQSSLEKITRKPVGPSPDEEQRNPRSRSAKLRAAEKTRV